MVFSNPKQTPCHLMRKLLLCLHDYSNIPQRYHQFLCNYVQAFQKQCPKYGHICQNCLMLKRENTHTFSIFDKPPRFPKSLDKLVSYLGWKNYFLWYLYRDIDLKILIMDFFAHASLMKTKLQNNFSSRNISVRNN